VAREHDGPAALAEIADELADLDDAGRVEAVGGLIEEAMPSRCFMPSEYVANLVSARLPRSTSSSSRSISAGEPRRPIAWKYRRFARPVRYG